MIWTKEIDKSSLEQKQRFPANPLLKTWFRYVYEDKQVKAEIFKLCHKDFYYYTITLNIEGLPKKEITSSGFKTKYKNVAQVKVIVENLIALIYKSHNENKAWIFKGVMLGFRDEEQMKHLNIKYEY